MSGDTVLSIIIMLGIIVILFLPKWLAEQITYPWATKNKTTEKEKKMERLTERKWTTEDNTQPTVVLETCAHCGGMADYRYNSGKVAVKCRTCGIETPYFELQTQAVAIWNKRVSIQQYV